MDTVANEDFEQFVQEAWAVYSSGCPDDNRCADPVDPSPYRSFMRQFAMGAAAAVAGIAMDSLFDYMENKKNMGRFSGPVYPGKMIRGK